MTDRFDPAPAALAQVIDPDWLTAMLRQRWPDATVRGVEVVETLATQATKVRLLLDVDDGGDGGDGGDGDDPAPRAICIKGVLTDTGAPPAASIVETLFYRDLARQVAVRVPPCLHAGMSGAGTHGVVVMRDMIAGGATFLSALVPFAVDDVRRTLDQLALLHVAGWQGGALFDGGVPRFLDQIGARPIIPTAMLQEMMAGERGAGLPDAVKDAGRLQRAIAALAADVRERPGCLVHGDAHAGNVYRDADGGLGLVDWQVLQRGEWAQDVAYTITAALTPEDRRRHERDLLDHYRDRLRSLGGPDLPREAAWTRYRAALVYGYYLWAITRKVEPAITVEFNRRLGLAVAELDSLAVVGA